jgi:hypothetical protein
MARRPARTNSCPHEHGAKARLFFPASHGDGSAQEHRRLRDSLRRGAAHLRHHGHLPGTVPRRRASTSRQHRQDQGGEKRKVRWCSRGVDGVVVAGLPETWRRCSGDVDVPQWRRCSRRRRTPQLRSEFPPLLVFVPFFSQRGPEHLAAKMSLRPGPVLGSLFSRRVAASARPPLLPTARRGGTPAFFPNLGTRPRCGSRNPKRGVVGPASNPRRPPLF